MSLPSNCDVEALRLRDPEETRRFYLHYGPLLDAFFRQRLNGRESVEDLRQEALYRVLNYLWQGRPIDDPERFGWFVRSVGQNVLLEYLRGQGRWKASEVCPELREIAPGPESAVLAEERRAVVRAVLDELKEQDRQLIEAIFFEEADREKVCRLHQVSREHLRVLLHRAVGRFGELYRRKGASA